MPEDTVSDLLRRRSFPLAATGYDTREVDRWLREVRHAHEAGQPLAPLLEPRDFTETGFGYDAVEVDGHRDELRRLTGTVPAPATPEPPVAPAAVPAPADVPAPSPAEPSEGTIPPMSPWTTQVAEQLRSVQFPRARGVGYDVDEVDRALDGASFLLGRRRPIRPFLRDTRFRMRRGGYDVEAVDEFLEGIIGEETSHREPVVPVAEIREGFRGFPGWILPLLLAIIILIVL